MTNCGQDVYCVYTTQTLLDYYSCPGYTPGMRLKALLLLTIIPTVVGVSSMNNCKRGYDDPVIAARMDETKCLATMVYGEARGETYKGKIAVAWSAVNRKNKSGKDLCDVVLAPKQYSIFNGNESFQKVATTFDIAPPTKNAIEQAAWEESWKVATEVVGRKHADPTQGATHYIAYDAMARLGYRIPRWAKEFQLTGKFDNHTFYKEVSLGKKTQSGKVSKKTRRLT